MIRVFLFLYFCLLSNQLMATVTVTVDRDPVKIDESFQLVFNSDEQTNGQPDFSPLQQNFTIISKSNRNSTKIENGKVTYSQQWVLTVLPRSTGQLQIPSVTFGKHVSPVRTINVIESNPAIVAIDDIFIEVSVDNPSPYVQAQVIYTVKLFRAVATSNATLSEPVLNSGQAIIDKIGDDTSYESQRQGRRYVVIERRYVIFPQNSGKITLEPLVFQAQTGSGGFFRFDPFGPAPKTIVKRSEALELDVRPIPSSYPGDTWLPASNLTIQEQWSVAPDKLQQGEAATRTLTIKATGLAASHLPALENAMPDDFKIYPDQPEFEETSNSDGFTGLRKEKMAVIPAAAGDFVLAPIQIYWWNTNKDKLEVAELPQRTLTVAASAVAETNVLNPLPASTLSQGQSSAADVNDQNGIWQLTSAIFLLLWLATLYAWHRANRRVSNPLAQSDNRAALKTLGNAVLKSARANDAAATRDALVNWAGVQWPDARVVNLGQIKGLVDSQLQQELDKLNSALYGKQTSIWTGEGLIKTFQAHTPAINGNATQSGKLEPLYKS